MKVLDKGFIEVIDVLGSDLTVVNAARCSFGKKKDALDESDIKLINYLAKNKHFSPFRHLIVQFHVKAPEVVARQWYKHCVGIETTSSYPTKDHAWNEISRRYVKIDEYYIPDVWRKQSESNKQGSDGELSEDKQVAASLIYERLLAQVDNYLDAMSELGIAKEQYQIGLPISFYTEWYWTVSFQGVMNFIELRNESHAQKEIQVYAIEVEKIIKDLYPMSYNAWKNK